MGAKVNFSIGIGETFSKDFILKDPSLTYTIDLDGFTDFIGTMKKSYTANTSYDLNVQVVGEGTLNFEIDETVTATLQPANYVYDVFATHISTGNIVKLIGGLINVVPSVSLRQYGR